MNRNKTKMGLFASSYEMIWFIKKLELHDAISSQQNWNCKFCKNILFKKKMSISLSVSFLYV